MGQAGYPADSARTGINSLWGSNRGTVREGFREGEALLRTVPCCWLLSVSQAVGVEAEFARPSLSRGPSSVFSAMAASRVLRLDNFLLSRGQYLQGFEAASGDLCLHLIPEAAKLPLRRDDLFLIGGFIQPERLDRVSPDEHLFLDRHQFLRSRISYFRKLCRLFWAEIQASHSPERLRIADASALRPIVSWPSSPV